MKAHFIASALNLKTDIDVYECIINALKKNDVTLTSSWLKDARKRRLDKDSGNNPTTWEHIYKENIAAISKADLIVAEISTTSFLVGFQVAYALQMKKPILLLSRLPHAHSAAAVGVNEEIINFFQYDEKNIEKIVAAFVAENSRGGKSIRFNFFIDRKILNYLKWASFQTGKTKSEIIRQLLVKEIDKSDFE